jgi:hypothetical protein
MASYRFGELLLDGRCYRRDLIVLPDRVLEGWWRREGHKLHLADLAQALAANISALVIGTGAAGAMQVPAEVVVALQSRGIQVVVQPTPQAVETFERLRAEGHRVAGAFHLTC